MSARARKHHPLTPNLPLLRLRVAPGPQPRCHLLPGDPSLQRPRQQLPARLVTAPAHADKGSRERVELGQAREVRPHALGLEVALTRRYDAPRLGDAHHLADGVGGPRQVGEHLVAVRHVERRVLKRQAAEHISLLVVDVGDPGHVGNGLGTRQDVSLYVDGRDLSAGLDRLGQRGGDCAGASTNI